jgi:hypothetical protein
MVPETCEEVMSAWTVKLLFDGDVLEEQPVRRVDVPMVRSSAAAMNILDSLMLVRFRIEFRFFTSSMPMAELGIVA